MRAALYWTNDEKPIDYRMMTLTDLLRTWKAHRNDPISALCAEEVCRRLSENMAADMTGAATDKVKP